MKNRSRRSEPTPTAGRPACPPHITGEAAAEWDRTCDELDQMGLLTVADRGVIARYAIAWARWVEAETKIMAMGKDGRMGLMVLTPNTKTPQHNPYLTTSRAAALEMQKCATELGLTPRARKLIAKNAAAAAPQQDAADDFADLD